MAEQTFSLDRPSGEETNVIEVPIEHIDKVKAYIETLASEEADVSGYSFSTASDLSFGSKGGSGGRYFTMTAIQPTEPGGDEIVGDQDRPR